MKWSFVILGSLLVTSSWITIKADSESEDKDVDDILEGIHSSTKPKESQDFATNLANNDQAIDKADPAKDASSSKGESAPGGKTAALKDAQPQKGSKVEESASTSTMFFIVVAAGCMAGFVGILMAGVCYYKYRSRSKAATEVGYPAYGETGPNKERIPSPGDRKLAQSAQMYHYQHQKQQMIAMEKANGDMKHDASDDESEEDNIEGDYTVYECPGLAPTGEMEVKNPLFRGEDTPVNPTQSMTDSEHAVTIPNGEEH